MIALRATIGLYEPTSALGPPGSLRARLSARQCEVAILVADGHTNKQVAAKLNLKEQTIRRYLVRISERLGLDRSRNVRVLITREVVFAWAEAA